MTELRVGFIGSGGLARHHMSQVARFDGARVAAICDVNRDAAAAPAEQYGVPAYSDHRQMMDAGELDAVYVAIPPFAHGQVELDLCAAGIPFFVQKPVALEMETAREVAAAVRKSGVTTCVGYQLRYSASAARLRAVLAGRKVGMGVGRYWCGFTQSLTRGWLIERAKSGGQIIEQATHLIDMIRFLAGEIVEAYGHETKMLAGGGDCPDVNCALLKLASGGGVTLTASWGTGESGDWSNANILQLFWEQYRADWTPADFAIQPSFESMPDLEPREIDAVFLNAVRTGDRAGILSDYEDGLRSLAVSVAIDESAASGAPVRIAEGG